MKAVIGTKSGKTYQIEIPEGKKHALIGKRIGDRIDGDFLGLKKYVLEIRGGSDSSGFPMHPQYTGEKFGALLTYGIGMRERRKGLRKRKTIRGNVISEDIAQINFAVVKEGEENLEKILGKNAEEDHESQ